MADSDPAAEYQETLNKARALAAAVAMAKASAAKNQGEREDDMIAVIDNYDSFTYNLVQYLGELGAEVRVFRNDAITVAGTGGARPQPHRDFARAGLRRTMRASRARSSVTLGPRRPLLGVCLGHQCIGAVFGGRGGARGAPDARQDIAHLSTTATDFFAGCPAPSKPPATIP